MALIPAFHEVFGWHLVPESRVRLHPDDWSTYDPTAHHVDEVLAYLETVGLRERARVLALEHQGKQRKTVLAEEHRLTATPSPPITSGDVSDLLDALNGDDQDHQTPDAAGAGDTDPAGDTPGETTED